jgi:hypothetical protein
MRNFYTKQFSLSIAVILFSLSQLVLADININESQTEKVLCNKTDCFVDTSGSFVLTVKIPSSELDKIGLNMSTLNDNSKFTIHIGNYNIEKILNNAQNRKSTSKKVTASWLENEIICKSYLCKFKKPITHTIINFEYSLKNFTFKIIGKYQSTTTANGNQSYGEQLFSNICTNTESNINEKLSLSIDGHQLNSDITGICTLKHKTTNKRGKSFNITNINVSVKGPAPIISTTTSNTTDPAGNYIGKYSGIDSGTVAVKITENGDISGLGQSIIDVSYFFNISGHLTPDGNISLIGEGFAGLSSFFGKVTSDGVISGTWSEENVIGGTFEVKKQNNLPLQGVFRGTVAFGAPVEDAEVSLRDMEGQIDSVLTDAMGGWIVPFNKIKRAFKPPFIVNAKFKMAGLDISLFSMNIDDKGDTISMNVTPITDMITRAYVAPEETSPESVQKLTKDENKLNLAQENTKMMIGEMLPKATRDNIDFIKDKFNPDPLISEYDALLERTKIGIRNGNVTIADATGKPMATSALSSLVTKKIGNIDSETITQVEANIAITRAGQFSELTLPIVNEKNSTNLPYNDLILPAPVNLVATKTGDFSWKLTWNPVPGARRYYLFQKKGSKPLSPPEGLDFIGNELSDLYSVGSMLLNAHDSVDEGEGTYYWIIAAASFDGTTDKMGFPTTYIGSASQAVSLTFGTPEIGLTNWLAEASTKLSWANAISYCASKGGKLPSIDQLNQEVKLCGGLTETDKVDYWPQNNEFNEKYQQCIKDKGFVGDYWSETTTTHNNNLAADIYFKTGGNGYPNKTSQLKVRCIK